MRRSGRAGDNKILVDFCLGRWHTLGAMFAFETHYEMLMLTPALSITVGQCGSATCQATHWRIGATWFLWTLSFQFST